MNPSSRMYCILFSPSDLSTNKRGWVGSFLIQPYAETVSIFFYESQVLMWIFGTVFFFAAEQQTDAEIKIVVYCSIASLITRVAKRIEAQTNHDSLFGSSFAQMPSQMCLSSLLQQFPGIAFLLPHQPSIPSTKQQQQWHKKLRGQIPSRGKECPSPTRRQVIWRQRLGRKPTKCVTRSWHRSWNAPSIATSASCGPAENREIKWWTAWKKRKCAWKVLNVRLLITIIFPTHTKKCHQRLPRAHDDVKKDFLIKKEAWLRERNAKLRNEQSSNWFMMVCFVSIILFIDVTHAHSTEIECSVNGCFNLCH